MSALPLQNDFISTSADLQEQVHCVKKLHHMLEVVASCNAFLNLGQDYLFPLTQCVLRPTQTMAGILQARGFALYYSDCYISPYHLYQTMRFIIIKAALELRLFGFRPSA
ncbi:hypothetical protein FKM82_018031 [Ascaphus truei]